jgi:GTP-binding protein
MTPHSRSSKPAGKPAPQQHPRAPANTATAATGSPSPQARAALAWLHGARFLTTASQLSQLPAGELPEIAFVGRSNAGKSTAINTLAQQRRLAFASRTPGRTQHINLFEVGPKDAANALLADLPGYGYAAVERSAKLRWQEVMSDYLQLRRNLHGVVLMIDSRLGFTDLDRRLLALLAPRVANGEVRLLALLTKVDKLNKSEGQRALQAAQGVLAEVSTDNADIGVTPFSALSRLGVEDVAEVLHGWLPVAAGAAGAGAVVAADAGEHAAEDTGIQARSDAAPGAVRGPSTAEP